MSIATSSERPIGSSTPRSSDRRKNIDRWFVRFCVVVSFLSVGILAILLAAILIQGIGNLSWTFLVNPPSPDTTQAGMFPAEMGTLSVCIVCALFALPLGVGTAILLEEYRPRGQFTRAIHALIQTNITNLAGVPSVVYGIIGLTAFVSFFGLLGTASDPAFEIGARYYDQFLSAGDRVMLIPVEGRNAPETKIQAGMTALVGTQRFRVNAIEPNAPLPTGPELAVTLRTDAEGGRINRKEWYYLRFPFGRGILAGALTMMLVVLPIVITSSQEALRAVPDSLREAGMGLGATRWQVIWNVTLPSAIPGIMTGSILSTSRAIGEAAPVLMIGGIVYITSAPGHLMDDFTVMPLQIFNWAQRPQKEFHELAATGIIVLLTVLLSLNAVAVYLRQRFHRPLS